MSFVQRLISVGINEQNLSNVSTRYLSTGKCLHQKFYVKIFRRLHNIQFTCSFFIQNIWILALLSGLPRLQFFDLLQYAKTCEMCATDHVVRFTKLSPSIFTYSKRSKTGGREGL